MSASVSSVNRSSQENIVESRTPTVFNPTAPPSMHARDSADLERNHDRPASEKTDVGEKRAEDGEKKVVEVIGAGPAAEVVEVFDSQFPDGGLDAWLVVLGAFFVSFSTWGSANAFGVYQDYYQSHQLSHQSPSTISWIGSIQLAMMMWGSLGSGRLFDQGYMRPIMLFGSFLVVFSIMMTSLCKNLWEIILAQGIGMGLGMGMIFVPAVSCVSHWFHRKRALANGVLAAGSSIGGITFPIMLNNMANNPKIGFGWAVRTTGFVILVCLIAANLLLKTRLPPNKVSGPLVDFRVFKDINFSLYCLGTFFIMFGLYLPIFYIQLYAQSKGVSDTLAFYLLSILNAASLFGRTIPNYLADKWGSLNVLSVACFVAGILIFIFLSLSSVAGFIIFAILFGFFSGTYVSSVAVCVAALTPDMSTIGLRLSMNFLVTGFAGLFGTPVDGALISRQHNRYEAAVIFSGLCVLLGSSLLIFVRFRQARIKGTARV